ncbi:hypothetical protein [Spiroplasma phoeniceum]|uniref:Uncharacterized protein n=1 Tax=Spiroplasma phoeniceum P40 TaxID=1276259 RepID=A0A345DLE9_9MOLU|nr:hypothetical protein [Spiroplasma phoeniceum]AXF95037.1 hypothetical protein SDAV_0021 [Spiroplasma phoeniceum P40]
MAQTKSNLSKKSITNKPKIKNKKVNKLELTVKLYENPIKTKIKALVAAGIEVDACFLSFRVDSFEIIQKAIRKRTNTNIKK